MRGNPTSILSSFTLMLVYVLHLPFPVSMYRLDWIPPTPPSLADFKFGIGADSHLRRKAEPLFSNRAVALSDISPGPFYTPSHLQIKGATPRLPSMSFPFFFTQKSCFSRSLSQTSFLLHLQLFFKFTHLPCSG